MAGGEDACGRGIGGICAANLYGDSRSAGAGFDGVGWRLSGGVLQVERTWRRPTRCELDEIGDTNVFLLS